MTIRSLCFGAGFLAALAMTLITPALAAEMALSFDGVDDVVVVPHSTALNAYPFTLTAWIKTDRNDSLTRQLVGKHTTTPTNGYGLYLKSGRISAGYARSSSAVAGGLQSQVVADGHWHHLALVADSTGSKLYVDGLLSDSARWVGTAGSPTDTAPLQMGTNTVSYSGLLDEVAMWNVARSPADLQATMYVPLAGTESGLVACWHLNEGAGARASDATGNGHDGTLANGIQWVRSTAFYADKTPPVLNCPASVEVDAAAGQCQAAVVFTAAATDNFDPAPAVTFVPPSGTVLPVGRTDVLCTARDSSGNSTSCTFPVTVYSTSLVPAGGIWTPAAGGWTRAPDSDWNAVASSADGTMLVAVVYGGRIYTSADSGVTWTARESNRNWTCVASSADGTRLVAAEGGYQTAGQIFTSTDSGATWTPRESPRKWASVASSADGSKLVAADAGHYAGGLLYTSTDSGVTWTARESDRNWRSVTSSADGTKLVAVEYGEFIYTSADSGVTWTPRESPRKWASVASSADGSKLVAADAGDYPGGLLYTSTDSGVTWTPRGSNRRWWSVASSADGTKLVAVEYGEFIYTSADSGVTWTARPMLEPWVCVASSVDGTKLVAVVEGGPIYTSTDFGATWATGSVWTKPMPDLWWTSIACSADGTKLVAAEYGGEIYTSTDSGQTWTRREGHGYYWQSVASSADGTKLVALASYGRIYTSTDSGVTWTARESTRYWWSVASSADGTKLVAADAGDYAGGLLYTSTDSGVTWTPRGSNRRWWSVASSADGTKLVALASHGQIYTSTDSGQTWTARESDRSWQSVASSADGTKLVALAGYGRIYTSTDSGVTWTACESDRYWWSVASSADGTALIAVDGGVVGGSGPIYTSTDSGQTWTARANVRSWQSVASSADGKKLFAATGGPDDYGQIYSSADTLAEQLVKPTILGATNLVVQAAGPTGAVVTYSVRSFNICQPSVPVSCTPPSGSTFPVGTTTVTCVAPDVAGSTTSPYASTATFTVTVTVPFSSCLTGLRLLSNGAFQFGFTDTPGAVSSVVATTNLALPLSNWTLLGSPLEGPAGVFQFTDPGATNYPQRYYRLRWP